jgi:hypothetical protein
MFSRNLPCGLHNEDYLLGILDYVQDRLQGDPHPHISLCVCECPTLTMH